MKRHICKVGFALVAAAGLIASAPAANPDHITVEADAGTVYLPSSTLGTLVMKTCGKCPLKSYPVDESTEYLLFEERPRPVTLDELKLAVAGHPDSYVGVTYSSRTGRVVRVLGRVWPSR